MKQLLDDYGVHLWQFQWPAERLQEQAGSCPENSSIDDIIAGDRGTSHLLTGSHQLWGRHKNQLRLWGGELHGLPQLLMANITVILGACRIRSFIFLFFPLRSPPDEKEGELHCTPAPEERRTCLFIQPGFTQWQCTNSMENQVPHGALWMCGCDL